MRLKQLRRDMENQNIKTNEMTRQIRDKHYEQLRGLTRAERLAFYRDHARLMNAKAEQILKAKRERVND